MTRQDADFAYLPAHLQAHVPASPGPCGPPDRFLAEHLGAWGWIADRVATLGDKWGPVLGQEPFFMAWSLLSSLERAARARACRCGP